MSRGESDKRAKLITLLNVAHARNPGKRKGEGEDWHEIAKRARKSSAISSKPAQGAAAAAASLDADGAEAEDIQDVAGAAAVGADRALKAKDDEDEDEDEDGDEKSGHGSVDPYKLHFATESTLLSSEAIASAKEGKWVTAKVVAGSPALGKMTRSSLVPGASAETDNDRKPVFAPRLQEKLDAYLEKQPAASGSLPTDLLNLIANYRDLLNARTQYESHDTFRAMTSLHAMSHINKVRQRILKNNEALAAAESSAGSKDTRGNGKGKGKSTALGSDAGDRAKPASTSNERETRDQGFTRPKVLILAPFRNSALEWMRHLTHFSLASQIENNARFQRDFSLPEGAVDKLATDEKDADGASKYPRSHRETFKGNIDDSFRVGLKVTRKSLKLYSEFYQSDLIIASPLGLRMSIEKEKSSDFLSSIEIVIADQLDVMQMQNWEHVQFVFDRLNEIPKEAHGCDFGRVKPWYLDGQAAHLRQTILLASQDSPEIRSLYSQSLVNVAGKYRTEQTHEGVLSRITPGVKQTFLRFDANGIQAEDDARFQYFTTKTLPALLQSAVASSHTLIFVPSYFDFIRLNAHLKTIDDLSFAVLSEYSSNSEISRARTNFFNGKKSFLVVTERFHFFRRYKIRGARTVVFYAPPEHADFYAEFLQYPFLRREVSGASKNRPEAEAVEEVLEANEVVSQTVFSKYDFLRLERIVGTPDAKRMAKSEQGERFSFV